MGITCPTSRYLTCMAESHTPPDKAIRKARPAKKGAVSIRHEGIAPNHAINPRKTRNANRRSSNGAIVADRGKISRGKYTLLINGASPTKLVALRLNACDT